LLDLGLPLRVIQEDERPNGRGGPVRFNIGRNEASDYWVEVHSVHHMGADDDPHAHYLFTKGTGKETWGSADERAAGLEQGARKIVDEEIGVLDLASLPRAKDK
jgi:hypothetical protein